MPDDRPAPVVDRLVHFYDGKSSLSRQLSATLLGSFEGGVEREYTKWVKSKDMERYTPRRRKHRLLFAAAAGLLAMLICMFSTLYDGIQFGPSLLAGLITFAAAVIIPAILRFLIEFVTDLSACRFLEQQSAMAVVSPIPAAAATAEAAAISLIKRKKVTVMVGKKEENV